jgi:aldehyde:ferredoxin oxidoreductase
MENILRVDVTNSSVKKNEIPEKYAKLGGRSLTARILLEEVDPKCEPLGRHNKLIFACGLFAATPVSSSGRISIGTKSPLTGGIKESNGGGITAQRMARAGLRAIIVEGLPTNDEMKILVVDDYGGTLVPAKEYANLGVYETARKIRETYPDSAFTCIGPAGEMQLLSAGITTVDKDGDPSRYSARGGVGAVMGSKNLKALVITAYGKRIPMDREKFSTAVKDLNKAIVTSPLNPAYRKYGTSALVEIINELNGLPIRNFSYGKDERAAKISADVMHNLIVERGGEGRTTHACMPGCLVACSNIFPDENGKAIVSPIEYENIGLLGPNLDFWDYDQIARLNYQCNDIGVDTIETGAAIGVAMEAGLLAFGDFDAVMGTFDQIRQGTPLGRLIASGAAITGKVLGVKNIPAVKGQSLAAYDPRAIKGMGVTYATSAMGADHTAGPAARGDIDHYNPAGKAKLSRKLQKLLGVFDSLGMCLFTISGVASNKHLVLDALNALFGWDHDMEWLDGLCIQMLKDEKRFNELAGITDAHHRLPEAFTERKMPGIDTVFDVTEEDIKAVFDYEKDD